MDKIDALQYITLGQKGENIATTIEIDVSEWQMKWPEASIFVIATRPDEIKPYVCNTSIEGNVLSWLVDEFDTSVIGVGHAEVRAVGMDGMIKKSRILKTTINRSITDEDAEYDDRNINFMNQMLSAAGQIISSRFCVDHFDEDGTVVLAGGSAEMGGYLLDTTLTQYGWSADAGAVGEALKKMASKEDLKNAKTDLLAAHPVGSWYISDVATPPDILLGGKWERVQGVVPFAVNGAHPVGTISGTETVTLFEDQVPAAREVNE